MQIGWLAGLLLAVLELDDGALEARQVQRPLDPPGQFPQRLFAPLRRAPKLTDKDTIVVADFANTTGDADLDRTLEPVFKLALEGANFISAYAHSDVRRSLGLQPPAVMPALHSVVQRYGRLLDLSLRDLQLALKSGSATDFADALPAAPHLPPTSQTARHAS